MVTAMLWTLIALMATGLTALTIDARTGRRELRAEIGGLHAEHGALRTELKGDIDGLRTELKGDIDGLRGEVRVLAERQAEMNGRLDLVAAMAHTHPPAVAGPHG